MRLFMRILAVLVLVAVGIHLAAFPARNAPADSGIADAQAGPHSLEWYKQHFSKPACKPGEATACFAPGTSPDVMTYFMDQMGFPDGERYNLGGGWTSQGDPVTLTWSFAPDGLSIPGGVGEATAPSELFSRMDTLFASQGGRATWINRFQQCFDRWAILTGVSYVHVTAAGVDWDDGAGWGTAGNGTTRGDVRISMHNIDGGSNILAYNQFPTNGDMVIDRSEAWQSSGSSNLFLRDVVMHEHGHGLGLAHVCPVFGGGPGSGRLMEPFINTAIDGPQHDEVRGVQRLYGDNDEPNNSTAAATNLGIIPLNTTVNRGAMPAPVVPNTSILSIDGDGEQDYYKFTVNFAAKISLSSVTPVGFTYDSSTQAGNGDCNSGNNVNSLTAQNLAYQIIGPDQVTVLATANSQPAGVAETLGEVQLNGSPGTFYIRIFEASSSSQSQLYNFSFTVVSSSADVTSPTPNPMTFASNPTAAAADAITMTATTATDAGTPPVQYFFDFTSGSGAGGVDSGWILSSTYVNSGVTPNNFYSYRVRAGDSAVPQNVTSYSAAVLGASGIETPTGVSFGATDDTSMVVNADGTFTNVTDPAFGSTAFFFELTPPDGSGANTWVIAPTTTITGLTPCTQYTIRAKARNFQATETPYTDAVVHFTTGCTGCLMEGDMNNNGVVDGDDIAGFTRTKLGVPIGGDYPLCADMGNGGDLDLDTAEFVNLLLGP
jgi:hypothetical protein